MKFIHSPLKKTFIVLLSTIVLLIIVVIIFISPISKYVIEKYDEEITGREIKTAWVYVNPFTGYIYLRNLKIYESKTQTSLTSGDSVFFAAKGLGVNFSLYKLFKKTIEISDLTLTQPKGIIIQNKKKLNFSDLIQKFTIDKTVANQQKFHFNIQNIKITNGQFYYYDKVISLNYYIKDVCINSSGKNWNSDTLHASFSFLSGSTKGSANGNFTINFDNLNYRFATVIDHFDLNFLNQYFSDITIYGTFRASLDANVRATGNFNDKENINIKGLLEVNDLHIGKNPEVDFASFNKLVLVIEELSPKNHLYLFDSLLLINPYFKYERYDKLDNLQTMFGKKGINVSEARKDLTRFNLIFKIGDYIKALSKNFFNSDYKIKHLAISNGCVKFNDYSLSEKFSIEANPLHIVADSINKMNSRVNVFLKTGIQPYGNVSVALNINPHDSGSFDMQYHLLQLPATIFNPYLNTYTSFPLDRGTIELNGTWNVKKNILKSNNHLLIIDPRLTQRTNTHKWIPSRLIMYFIRERGNIIDYEIPINGNLKTPKFFISDIVFDVFENIFIKPVTTAYRMQVSNAETEIEKSLALIWKIRQHTLLHSQEQFVAKMVDFLLANKEAVIIVNPIQYAEKEKELIMLFEAKKKYFLSSQNRTGQSLSEDDSLKIENLSIKDLLFEQYLNKQVGNDLLFTIQDKSNVLIGSAMINNKFNQLKEKRKIAFMQYFKNKSVDDRVIFSKSVNNIPYNGFSFYKIGYNGEFPASLLKAYEQMNELNHEAPRNRFEKKRQKNRIILLETKQ